MQGLIYADKGMKIPSVPLNFNNVSKQQLFLYDDKRQKVHIKQAYL